MSILTTMDTEITTLITGNTIYENNKAQWSYLLASYMGGQEYKEAKLLSRYMNETEQEYAARISTTPVENHCKSVISVYNSFMFREKPERDYGSLLNTVELESFIKDADLDGRSLDNFMKEVSIWSAVFGHSWIVIAKPNVNATTRAEEMAYEVRPYVNLINPLAMLDWTWERSRSGKQELSYIKYIEDVNGDNQTIKEWYTNKIRTTIVNALNRKVLSVVEEANGLGIVPAVCAYSNRSPVRGLGLSQISDIADAQRFIYNNTSEVYQSIRLDSHPSLVVTPDVQVETGAGSLIKIPENMDPGLVPYVLEFSGATVASIYESINHTIASIDKMANTGSIRANEAKTMSGVAMQTEFELLNAKLSEMSDNLELAEEQMWRIYCMYQNQPYDMTIDYPGSFNIRDTASEVTQLQTAKNAATSPLVLAAIDAEILGWMDIDEDEKLTIKELLANPSETNIVNPEEVSTETDDMSESMN